MPKLTKAEHLALAEHIATLRDALHAVSAATGVLPKSAPVRVALRRHEHTFGMLRSHLDSEWHQAITAADFKEYGHVYYGRRVTP